METEIFRWRDAWSAVWRRRSLLAAVAIIGTLSAIAFAFLQPPVYVATAKLAAVSERAHIVLSPDPRAGAAVDKLDERDLNAEVALLRSRSLVRDVVAEEKKTPPAPQSTLEKAVAFLRDLPGELYRRLHDVDPPGELVARIEDVTERLSIEPIAGSNLIQIEFRDDDPGHAAAFVSQLTERHLARRALYNQRPRTRQFFERQRELLAEKRRKAEQSLQSFYDSAGIDATKGDPEAVQDRLSKLEVALADARRELAESIAHADFLREELRGLPKSIAGRSAPSASQQAIRARVVELQLERDAMLTKFAPTSSRIREIDQQIAAANRLLNQEKKVAAEGGPNPARDLLDVELAKVRARIVALQARIPALENQIAQHRPLAERLAAVAPQRERLVADVQAAKEALRTYSRKEEEVRFSNDLDELKIVNVTVVEPPVVPAAPEASTRMRIILVGAAFSILLGVVLALFRDRLDQTVKTDEEIFEASGGIPVLSRLSP